MDNIGNFNSGGFPRTGIFSAAVAPFAGLPAGMDSDGEPETFFPHPHGISVTPVSLDLKDWVASPKVGFSQPFDSSDSDSKTEAFFPHPYERFGTPVSMDLGDRAASPMEGISEPFDSQDEVEDAPWTCRELTCVAYGITHRRTRGAILESLAKINDVGQTGITRNLFSIHRLGHSRNRSWDEKDDSLLRELYSQPGSDWYSIAKRIHGDDSVGRALVCAERVFYLNNKKRSSSDASAITARTGNSEVQNGRPGAREGARYRAPEADETVYPPRRETRNYGRFPVSVASTEAALEAEDLHSNDWY